MDLRKNAKKFEKQLKKIRVFLCDVDGILTNGKIAYDGEEIGFNRSFNVLDGYGLKVLRNAGIKIGVISGGSSLGLRKRFEYIKLDFFHVGNEDKRQAYLDVKEKSGHSDEEILYIGDEFFDLPILKRVGFSVTVPNASHEVQESVDYITHRQGGQGCVREVIDMVRYAQNIVPKVPDFD
jgi:3-deoxy-D-manno-octulosonate 8-phosphate phosphatase (KDO 8-P phosphatase)